MRVANTAEQEEQHVQLTTEKSPAMGEKYTNEKRERYRKEQDARGSRS
jgi:hypothetical protein